MTNKAELAQRIADDFIAHLDAFHSIAEVWDNDLDAQIAGWYANPPKVWPKRPYFSPSSANACPRNLYYKAKKAPKDEMKKQPHQSRWQKIGTGIGDMIQREVLSMERNYEDKLGESPRFRFERNEDGTPVFEDFAKKNVPVTHKGRKFYLYGTGDGVMEYITEDGEKLRIGLEVKSKQTSAARTSAYSMRAPEESHVKQCACYAEMYDLDMFIILYVNAAHKGWVYTDEDYAKTPDIRAFGIHVTEQDKSKVFDRFAAITDSIKAGKPLHIDPTSWLFNPYKTQIAQDIEPDELARLRKLKEQAIHSSLPDWKKRPYVEVVEFIEETIAEGAW